MRGFALLLAGLIVLVATSSWSADYEDLTTTGLGLKSADFKTADRWVPIGHDFRHSPIPLTPNAAMLFRDPPTLTPHYGGSNKSWIPFFGLGFQGGETSDITRQLFRESMRQSLDTRSSISSLEKSLVPNEFQGGLRIPF